MVCVALSKQPINQFKPVQKSIKKVLRAYCPNIYTVEEGEIEHHHYLQKPVVTCF
jgi:hypothetical protein